MSEYSLDSLESVEDDSLEKCVSINSDNDDNLRTVESVDRSIKDPSSPLNSALKTSSQIQDSTKEANWIVREDRCTSTTGCRNSIITSGRGFARRQQECRATRAEPWLCIRKRNDVGERREDDASRRRCRRTSSPTTMATMTTTTTTTTATAETETKRRSPGARNSSSKCSLHDSGGGMRADKKLGNVLTPCIRGGGPAKSTSYSELYHRRFDIPRYPRIQSPEGSTLSICGDSQLEELSLDEGRSSLPGTSRDDSSELSFYRRFIEGHAARVTRTGRSCEILNRRILPNTVSPRAQRERSVSDSKLKKPTYRPYTIEEYRSLSVPRPDRSLGPDKDEVQIKREWLMRRRSYGDSVSARNCEQILQRTRRFKDHASSRIPETSNVTQESLLKRPAVYQKEGVVAGEASPSRKSEALEKAASFGSSLILCMPSKYEGSYLETLQQRHLQERELTDRLVCQALNF